MIPLPCRVRPLTGETPDGFLGRLAATNAIGLTSLQRYIWQELGLTTANSTNARYVAAIEQAGGLEPGHFAGQHARSGLFRRCHHHHWLLTPCRKCGVLDRPRAACSVCSDGILTEVVSRGGGFCVRHRRWHMFGQDELIRPPDVNRHAEQVLSGRLWNRGVTMHTGEIALAITLIQDSRSETSCSSDAALSLVYGPAVELALTLTDASVALSLSALSEGEARQVEGLIGLTIGAGRGSRTPELERTAALVVAAHRTALDEAVHMPNSPATRVRIVRFEKGIAEASFRSKAVLLRHVTRPGRRVNGAKLLVRGAPSSRVVSRRIVPGWADDAPWIRDVVVPSTASKVGDVVRNQVVQ